MIITNEQAYKPAAINRVVRLEVVVMLDAVPGAWHEPDDIMRWICMNAYVQSVELKDGADDAAADVETWMAEDEGSDAEQRRNIRDLAGGRNA